MSNLEFEFLIQNKIGNKTVNKFDESKNRLGMKMNFCSLFCLCSCFHFVPLMLSSLFKLSEERGNAWKAQYI